MTPVLARTRRKRSASYLVDAALADVTSGRFTVREAAEHYSLTRQAIYNAIKRLQMPMPAAVKKPRADSRCTIAARLVAEGYSYAEAAAALQLAPAAVYATCRQQDVTKGCRPAAPTSDLDQARLISVLRDAVLAAVARLGDDLPPRTFRRFGDKADRVRWDAIQRIAERSLLAEFQTAVGVVFATFRGKRPSL